MTEAPDGRDPMPTARDAAEKDSARWRQRFSGNSSDDALWS